MAFASQNVIFIGGWKYYHFETIQSANACKEIASACLQESRIAKIQAIVAISLGILSLSLSFIAVQATFELFAIHHLALSGFLASCPVLGYVSLPFLMLSIVTARYWSYAEHLEKQAAKADLREKDIIVMKK